MLKKTTGCTLISKLLSAILLMEANFYFSNRIIFDVRVMDDVRQHGWVPKEIYGNKGNTANDSTLAKAY